MTGRQARRSLPAQASLLMLLVGLVALPASPSGAVRSKPGRFDRSGIEGSGLAVMQPVNVGLRVALVASVPGSPSKEAWAVGLSSAKLPGWAGTEGQTVFLHHTSRSGWLIVGPPVGSSGGVQNPKLTSISLAANGDGWAVGDKGAMVRLSGGRWVMAPNRTDSVLTALSVGSSGGAAYGFAVGDGPTVLRLFSGDNWVKDDAGLPVGEDESWDLLGVSAVGPNEAWVSGASLAKGVSSGDGVLILHRTSGGWDRVLTNDPIFDAREARRDEDTGTVVVSARAPAVAATGGGAWVGGTIVPVKASASLGDPAGDPTRPFVLHVGSGGVTSYCPDDYILDVDQNPNAERKATSRTTALCDKPFPLSGFGIVAMQAFPGDEVFAGGLGLFHHRDGSWFREPNAVGYLTSVGLSSPTEGWVAGSGNAYGVAASVSSIGTLGHWTKSPATPRMARWPEPVTDANMLVSHPLEAVAVAPDGSGRAVAVGQQGAMLIYKPEVGWDSFNKQTNYALHDVVWPSASTAWAIGGQGTILRFDGTAWRSDPNSERLTRAALFGAAFSSATRGYAVGATGAILRYDGVRWSKDPAHLKVTTDDLYAVDAAGDQFVAVGANGTVLVNRGGTWSRESGLEGLLSRGGQIPALYAVEGLSDGTALAGGESNTLIRRDGPRGGWRVESEGARVPPEGTILALAARRSGSGLNIFASVSYEPLKFSGENPAAITGFLLYGTPAGWRDLDFKTRMTTYPVFDASAPRDPVYGVALEGASKAWAVGGTGAGNDDFQGHVQAYPTSSIYRVDLTGDPEHVGNTTTPILDTDSNVISFAFFGESMCGRGLCSVAMGTGTKADVVAAQIQDEINAMSGLPGGPRFVVFGGNMRATGIPEELGQFKRFADGFRIPFYASLGAADLFGGLQKVDFEDIPDFTGGELKERLNGPADDSFYLDAFSDRPKPWGRGDIRGTIEPVLSPPAASGSRTHYAFDYVVGKKRLRIIVLDDSLPLRLSNKETQNPPNDQKAWLKDVLLDARDPMKDAVSIVIMNRPSLDPHNHKPDLEVLSVEQTAGSLGAGAVVTAFYRENHAEIIDLSKLDASLGASTMPVYVFGGGGAPLTSLPDRPPDPSLGKYHSWQLVSVNFDEDRRAKKGILRQGEVYAYSYPVVDTVSIHAIDGVVVPGGQTLRFTGSGRAPDGGGPNDPLQSRAALVPLDFGSAGISRPDIYDKLRPKIQTATGGSIGPAYLYVSEDRDVGYFARPDPIDPTGRRPYIDPAREAAGLPGPLPDPTSGLFCAIGAGTTYVSLISGFHRSRMQVTVTGGYGPCVKEPVVQPPPLTVAQLAPLPRPAFQPFLAPPPPEPQTIALVPPPPVPVVAPAPPASGAYAKREKHEEAKEMERTQFTAIRHESRYETAQNSLMLLLGAGVLALAAALVLARWSRTTPEAARFYIDYPDGRRKLR